MAAICGASQCGAASLGSSTVYEKLPYKNYRSYYAENITWLREFFDATGIQWEILDQLFISQDARTNLLDPTYSNTLGNRDTFRSSEQASTTAAPTQIELSLGYGGFLPRKISTDTMLDLMCYIAGIPFPLSPLLTIEQKQALVIAGPAALRRKGTRQQLVSLATALTNGVGYGWKAPPFNFSLILPDGAPDPGAGDWAIPVASKTNWERPWILPTTRQVISRIRPDWSQAGVGFSQFRAGYSGAGEPVFEAGARINILANEHFATWTAGSPDSWIPSSIAYITQDQFALGDARANINREFSSDPDNGRINGSCVSLDLISVGPGITWNMYQTATVNNQVDHVLEFDYNYIGPGNISSLWLEITDNNGDYWDPENDEWSSTAVKILLPPDEDIARLRYTCNITPQAASSSTVGTQTITPKILTDTDGTDARTTLYIFYRMGLYEKFDVVTETDTGGDRTLWLPLVDAPGRSAFSGSTTGSLSHGDAARRSFRVTPDISTSRYDYHPALSGHGYSSNSAWTNLLLGSYNLVTDWTATSVTSSLAGTISPIVGETVASAPTFTCTAKGGSISQANVVGNPSTSSYSAGIWAKKISADINYVPAGTVTFTAASTGVVGSGTAFASAWIGFEITSPAGIAYQITAVADTTHLTIAKAADETETGSVTLSDIKVELISGATKKTQNFSLTHAEGWKRLAMQVQTFDVSDTTALTFKVTMSPNYALSQMGLTDAYCYDVTTMGNVLYPPVQRSEIGSTGVLGATALQANTYSTTAKHPYTHRRLLSIVEGTLMLTVVPTFDLSKTASGNYVIFDFGHTTSTANRLQLAVSSSGGSAYLMASLCTNLAGNSTGIDLGAAATFGIYKATMRLTTQPNAQYGWVTWQRDKPVDIRLRWRSPAFISLSAGDSYASTDGGAGTALADDAAQKIIIGANLAGNYSFDGIIRAVEGFAIGSS